MKSKNTLMAVIVTSIVAALADTSAQSAQAQPAESPQMQASSLASLPDFSKAPAVYKVIVLTRSQEAEVNQLVTSFESNPNVWTRKHQDEVEAQACKEEAADRAASPLWRHMKGLFAGGFLLLVAFTFWLERCFIRRSPHTLTYAPAQSA